jgi:hypothetical protein
MDLAGLRPLPICVPSTGRQLCFRLPPYLSLQRSCSLVLIISKGHVELEISSTMAAVAIRTRYIIFLALTLVLLTLFVFRVRIDSTIIHPPTIEDVSKTAQEPSKPTEEAPDPTQDVSQPTDDIPKPSPSPVYKNVTAKPSSKPIGEYFPIAAKARSRRDLPTVPPWNKPPRWHGREKTPLFIGFTRNWPLLQQAVVGYITAGWPPEDIIVVENTGVMDANEMAKLTLQNPFYLDHHRLKDIFGVKVMVAPVLYTFAQLQNFYLYEAIKNKWPHYFWSHMDVMPQSREDREPFKSFYKGVVDAVRESEKPGFAKDDKGRTGRWALRFFAYDWLTMMNTAIMEEIGGWDTMISYYTTDCDMYERMRMLNLSTDGVDVGNVWDMYESLPDLSVLYREGDTRNSSTWHEMQDMFKKMQDDKNDGAKHPRNDWQITQTGGQGEPYYRDLEGFAEALEINVQAGIQVYQSKWGKAPCGLRQVGLGIDDAWRVDHIENL